MGLGVNSSRNPNPGDTKSLPREPQPASKKKRGKFENRKKNLPQHSSEKDGPSGRGRKKKKNSRGKTVSVGQRAQVRGVPGKRTSSVGR